MDERIRGLERQAKTGDLDAALAWFRELNRVDSKDYEKLLECMKLIGELQYPGMMETIRELEELEKLTGPPYVDGPGVWSSEIVITDNTGVLEIQPNTGLVFNTGD